MTIEPSTHVHLDDPLDRVLYAIDDSQSLQILIELQSPTDPGTPPLTPEQIRAALHAIDAYDQDPAEYTTQIQASTCPICYTEAFLAAETGPHPSTGEQIIVQRWRRHPHPVTGQACCAMTTWYSA